MAAYSPNQFPSKPFAKAGGTPKPTQIPTEASASSLEVALDPPLTLILTPTQGHGIPPGDVPTVAICAIVNCKLRSPASLLNPFRWRAGFPATRTRTSDALSCTV